MFYIVGLGNPGVEYRNTRHNIGFMLVEAFVEAAGLPKLVNSSRLGGRTCEGIISGKNIIVLLPETFMNHSGSSVMKLVPPHESAQLIVVYDDVDLSLGDVKISFGRSAGGHNGIASIIKSLNTRDFIRIRVGIAGKSFWTGKTARPAGHRLARHVLGTFTKREVDNLTKLSVKVNEIITTILLEGTDVAMNRFN